MNVSEAVASRKSIRAFLDDPVDTELLADLLKKASRSPSGGNVQPWRITLLGQQAIADFRAVMKTRLEAGPPDTGEYNIYPPDIGEPYKARQRKVASDMYGLLGIGKEDKAGRIAWMGRNFDFFGAPNALFCHVERHMGQPQWSDLGMFLQTFMLLLQEAGIDSCPQEAWSLQYKTVDSFLKMPPEWMLFCGMAIGYRDPDAPVNNLVTERASTDEWLTVI